MKSFLPTALVLLLVAAAWEVVVRVQQVPLYLVPPPSAIAMRWLRDPASQKRTAHMPKIDLTEEEIQALAAYLSSLR